MLHLILDLPGTVPVAFIFFPSVKLITHIKMDCVIFDNKDAEMRDHVKLYNHFLERDFWMGNKL